MGLTKRAALLAFPLIGFFFISNAQAQGYYRFLGNPRTVPNQTSERNGIVFNTQGFDNPTVHETAKMIKKGASGADVDTVENFPGSSNAFSEWVDDAFDQTRASFEACGGSLASLGSKVSPKAITVTIEPSGFYVPELGYAVAGAYFPSTHEIHVLNIYYTWSGANNGWLRQASDLLVWEMGNYFATETGIQAEPRTPHWPCDAPKQ
ncbi:MAG TPA: hypothetical protein VI756_23520 [Blastocatellia bacterium]